MLGELVLGRYRVIRLLDEGGMSKIYLARQADPPRDVVVKVLKEPLRAQAKVVEHFRREIYIMSRFQHPHAVAYYDSAQKEKWGPVLVMEYLRGVDLGVLLQREGRMSAERAGRLLAQLCDALGAAHSQGIVHRDLKPGNLMVLHPGTPMETLKLMDFGLAKMSSAMLYISPEELVDFNLPPAAGTPEYISPEMVRGNEMDGRGDLYSVGVVLFELLTGKRPFRQTDVEDLLEAHASAKPPRFSEVGTREPVPPALEAVVLRCLAKHPDERFASAWELALAYEKALGRKITGPRPATPAPTNGSGSRTNVPVVPVTDRSAVKHSVEVNMCEALAMVKLKGFIYDLGGEVVESVPGMIRVKLLDKFEKRAQSPGKSGILALLKGNGAAATQAEVRSTELEMHMERPDPNQANRLTITLVMRSRGLITVEWRRRCEQIGRSLQAYLMGR